MTRILRSAARSAVLGALALGLSLPALAGKIEVPGDTAHAQNPVFSLDGKFLTFEGNSYKSENGIQMYFAPVSEAGALSGGIKEVKLPGSGGAFAGAKPKVGNPSWHPQGLAVFEGSNSGGKFRLYFAMPNGASAAEMMPSDLAPGSLQFPVASPDGNLLGYTSSQYGMGDVMSWDRSTNAVTRMTKTDGVTELYPQFSKDGKTMLFMRKNDSGATVHSVGVGTAAESKLVNTGRAQNGDQTRPTYAGDQVVFFSNERAGEGHWDLLSVPRGGGTPKVLAKEVKLPYSSRPAVTPDGRYVAFVSAEDDTGVRVMDLASGTVKKVTINGEFTACGEPALGVQGGKVLLAFTALPPEDSAHRFLYVTNITNQL